MGRGYVSEGDERSQQFVERHSHCAGLNSCTIRQRSSYHPCLEETRQRLDGNCSAGWRSQTFESEGHQSQCFPVTCFHIIFKVTQTGLITTSRLLFARQAKGKRKLVLWRCYVNQRQPAARRAGDFGNADCK